MWSKVPVSNYGIRLYADTGNLPQFSASVLGVLNQLKSAYRSSTVSPVTSKPSVAGMDTSRLTTQIDAYNRTLTQSGQVFHRYVAGYAADLARLDAAATKSGKGYSGMAFNTPYGPSVYGSTGKAGPAAVGSSGFAKNFAPVMGDLYSSNYSSQMGNLDRVMAAQKALLPMAKQIDALSKQAEIRAKAFEAKGLTYATVAEQAKQQQTSLISSLATQQGLYGGTAATYDKLGNVVTPAYYKADKKEATKLAKSNVYQTAYPGWKTTDIATEVRKDLAVNNVRRATAVPRLQQALIEVRNIADITKAINDTGNFLVKVDKVLAKLTTEVNAYKKGLASKITAIRKGFAPQLAELTAAQTTPFVPQQLDQMLQKSKSLRNQLIKGLEISAPYGTTDFAKQFNEKVSNVSVTRDMARGFTNISMEARSADGVIGNMNTTLDRNYNTVEKLSGSYRNTGGALKMIAVDFKKVLEWTVATTVVFGAFGVVLGSVSKINKISMELQRFQIVAKTTGAETTAMFESIADIAYRTATPLTELVSVMDDIALATRRTGQTTQEWAGDMNALAEAVGIFTNIAGVDTLKATELLSATFKQLQIAPEQLVGLLSKVTAVAGGNSQAVQDIVSALGTVAEAGKAAGLTVDKQIAAVQVLAQVTNKSAADIATSFKNLFGAINAPAAKKVLGEFGISVRDSSGNLRDFLDIYKDIYAAIQSGGIPQGRVQDVLRAISGGPRRAPDAAAILGNLPRIFETIDKSVNATNEALIANAKILGTNAAQLQQIRTAFDTVLVEQFTTSINKLVSVIVLLGKSINEALGGSGGIGGSLANGVMTFGLMAAGVSIAVKGVMGLRNVLKGLMLDLKVLETSSKVSSSLFGNATFNKRTGAYTSTLNLEKIDRPGYDRFVSTYKTGTRVNRAGVTVPTTIPTSYEYWPRPGTTPTKPEAFNVSRISGSAKLTNLLSTSRGARLGAGGLGGAALGLGMGAAAMGTGSGAFSTIGQTLGMMGLMSFNPVGMAAGAASLIVSSFFQAWIDGAEKAREKQKLLQGSIYDQIQALTENQRVLQTANETRAYNKATIDELSQKTNKTTIETGALTAAQQAYVTATMDVINAERALANSRDALFTQLPQLDKYKDLAKNAMSLSADSLKMLSTRLAEDILKESGTFIATTGLAYREAFPTQNYTPVPPVFGKKSRLRPTETILENFRTGGVEEVIKYLRTTNTGVVVTPELTETMDILLKTADADVKKTSEFAEAVKIFETSVLTLEGAVSPFMIMNQNLASLQARTQANAAFGVYTSNEASNASARQAVGLRTLELSKNLPKNIPFNPGGAILTQKTIEQMLFGPNGFVSSGGEINKADITPKMAKDVFGDYITRLDPALADIPKDSAMFGEMTYQFFKNLTGLDLKGLRDPVIEAAAASEELRINIEESVTSAKAGLFDELIGIQAKKQGGEYKGIESIGRAEEDQIYSLIDAYTQLGTTFAANDAVLPALQEKLGSLKTLQKLLLVDTKDLLPAFLDIARTMGLTGSQIDVLKIKVLELVKALTIVQNLPTVVAGIKTKLDTAVASGNPLAIAAAIKEINAALGGSIEASKTANILTTAIGKLLSLGGGTGTFAESPADSIKEAKAALFADLDALQAAIQGGEYKDNEKVAQLKIDQIMALANAYDVLSFAFEQNQDSMPKLTEGLNAINGLKSLVYDAKLGTDDFTTSLLTLVTQLGLTGPAIGKLNTLTFELFKTLAAIKLMPDIVKRVTIEVNTRYGTSGSRNLDRADTSGLTKEQLEKQAWDKYIADVKALLGDANKSVFDTSSGSSAADKATIGALDVPEEWKTAGVDINQYMKEAIAWAKKYQSGIPGENKEHLTDLVAVMDGNNRILLQKGIAEEYMRKAMDNLTEEIKKQNDLLAKADTIRRIRVGAGDFAALANVPINKTSGLSIGGPQGPITVSLNVTGQILTPAQLQQLANMIAAGLGKNISG
jgi:hypothetical protein